MGLFDNFKKAEARSIENPNTALSADNFLHMMCWGDFQSSAGVTVNIEKADGVPTVWAALKFISAYWPACRLKYIAKTSVYYQNWREGLKGQ